MQQKLLLLLISFFAITICTFIPNKPDAIRCGDDNSCSKGAIYFAHIVSETNTSYYCQVCSGEDRCVLFNSDGTYQSGRGHYESRKGCENKSIADLQK